MENNLRTAFELICNLKKEDIKFRFRIETCVSKASVKVYVIKKLKIEKVITIDEGVVTEEVK